MKKNNKPLKRKNLFSIQIVSMMLIFLVLNGCIEENQSPSPKAEPIHSEATIEKNKEAVRYLIEEIIGKGLHDKYKQLHTSDFILHSGKDSFNLKQDYQLSLAIKKDFPDMSLKVVRLVAENNFVVVYWQANLTQKKEKGYFPTIGITMFRLRDGKIVEEWNGDCPDLK